MRKFSILILCIFFFPLEGKEKICLNMIVKNESKVICRCLDSVKPLIDYWVIVDTGSTDGTQEIIKEHMRGIPGELHERPWKNFGENREEALELANGKGDYLLFMDADDFLVFEEGFVLPQLTEGAYFLWRKRKDGSSWLMPHFIKMTLPWRWEGVLHEIPTCGKPVSSVALGKVYYSCGDDGSSHDDPLKFQKYIQILEEGLRKEPENRRYAYYLAQSYRMVGEKEKALEAYAKRVDMGGSEDEIFWSLLNMGLLLQDLGRDKKSVVEGYQTAQRYRPHRKESAFFLAQYYNSQNEYQQAYDCLKEAEKVPSKRDRFFQLDWVEEYGLLYDLLIASYGLGKYHETLLASEGLLQIAHLPENIRDVVRNYRDVIVQRMKKTKKICLNMIVKNESQVIRRALDSVKWFIDYWVIVDTGSTDDTKEIIKKHMEGIPGELHARPWKNFGENREEALELARGKGDYLLILDADDFLRFDEGFVFPELTKDAYYVWHKRRDQSSWLAPQLIKMGLPWKWEGVVHEVISCDLTTTSEVLEKVSYCYEEKQNLEKVKRYIQLLEGGLKNEPRNGHYMYHLAQSCHMIGEKEKALQCAQKRVKMGGDENEIFWALLHIALLQQELGYEKNKVVESFQKARQFRPHRKEPICLLAEFLNTQKEFQKAYDCLQEALKIPSKKDSFHNLDWVEEYGLLFQLAIAAKGIGKYGESIDACQQLLKVPHLPEDVRGTAIALNKNKKICLNMIVKDESHVIKRCLDSVKSLIDTWVIVDTGSTDGTKEIIKKEMQGIPGELHARSWKNFGANRQEALELAKGKGDYVLFMDADDYLKFERGFVFPQLTEDAYCIWHRREDKSSWVSHQLVRADLPWKWKGVVHEELSCNDRPTTDAILGNVLCIYGEDGASHKDPLKMQKYIQLLEEGLKSDPDNAHYMYHLAQSYRSIGERGSKDAVENEKALEWFSKRAKMSGREDETFWSLLHIAMLLQDMGRNKGDIVESYKAAMRNRPYRKEPVFFLAQFYNSQNDFQLAYDCLKGAEKISNRQDFSLQLDWVEEYGLLFQLAIAANGIGKYEETVDVSNRLFQIPHLPENIRRTAIALCKNKKVCLNMIVKNESHVIQRCLDSVKSLIDYWVVVDTGSTDGTQEIIQKCMQGIPGELHARPWKNFGANRQEALELAKGKGDYILFMDADDHLECEKDFALPPLTQDIYTIWREKKGEYSFCMPFIVKASLPLEWVGVTHEGLDCSIPHTECALEKIRYFYNSDGARAKDPKRFEEDIRLLEDALKKEPNNSRSAFYLAQSYRALDMKGKAVEWYQKRSGMGGCEEEVYWSLLQLGRLLHEMGFADSVVAESYKNAHNFRPERKEAIYSLIEIYNQQREYQKAYDLAKSAMSVPCKKDHLFNLDWIDTYGFLCQLSIAAYWVGNYQESLDVCDRLLKMEHLPADWRKATEKNREFALAKLR